MNPDDTPVIRPWLKWAGGKRQLLSEIQKHLPRNRGGYTYCEPFAGAGAVFLSLLPAVAVINDLNTQLVNCYLAIRDNIDELVKLLETHRTNNGESYYYAVRAMDRDTAAFEKLTAAEKAARLIYLNKTCYNGLYRVNSQGFFNVPYGHYRQPAIFDEAALRAVHRYFADSDITFLNGDFADAVRNADGGSFVYFDPPYHSAGKGGFTAYQAAGFGEAEQIRLRDCYAELSRRGARCLLSNADTGFIRNLYAGADWEIITLQANRAINSNAAGRGRVNEVLVKNWKD
jgi:DNA adenine methylase